MPLFPMSGAIENAVEQPQAMIQNGNSDTNQDNSPDHSITSPPSPPPQPPKTTTNTITATTSVPTHILVKNRRQRYLSLTPTYFSSPALELASPLLYDRLIRRFQSAAERESEGRAKGYSGILEADILRSEAKLDSLRNPDPNASIVYTRGANGEIVEEDEDDEVPLTKEEGMRLWKEEMERRFVEGRDAEFEEYEVVDGDEGLDVGGVVELERELAWFEEESPAWGVGEQDDDGVEVELKGETGIQDF